jgi:hypothetical protein
MPSNAISFQGSTLEISTGSGGAKTISDVAVGFPTIITSTAHGLKNGDVVTLASFAGADAALLNGQTVNISNVTINTFAVQINTIGKIIDDNTNSATATPVAFTEIDDVKSIKFATGSRTEMDVTNLKSTAKEKILGLKDNGSVTGDINIDLTSPGQTAFRASLGSDDVKVFRVTLPGSAGTCTFNGQAKKLDESGAVDSPFSGSYEIAVKGDYTWA